MARSANTLRIELVSDPSKLKKGYAEGERATKSFGDSIEVVFRQAEGKAEESAEGIGDSFGSKLSDLMGSGLKGSIGGLAAVATGATAGLALVGGAIAIPLVGGFLAGLDIQKAEDKFAAQLGRTPELAKTAGEAAGAVYRGAWGDSLEQVHGAVQAVITGIDGMTDATQGELELATQRALDLAGAFDVDVQDAIRSVGALIEHGLAPDAEHAFDLITAAMQEVPAVLRQDVLDAVEEYGGFFVDLGLNGAEAMQILTEGAERGVIGLDKAGDAVKEFTIRSTDMSTASQEAYEKIGLDAEDMADKILAGGDTAQGAFQQIVEGLLGIESPSERANAAIALFGTPIEDLRVTEIPAFLESLLATEGGLANVEGSAQRAGDTLNDNFATKIEALKRGGLSVFTTFMTDAVIPAVESFTGELGNGEGALESARNWVETNAPAIKANLVDVFETVVAWVRDEAVPWVRDELPKAIQSVQTAIATYGPMVVTGFQAVGTAIGGIKTVLDAVRVKQLEFLSNTLWVSEQALNAYALLPGEWGDQARKAQLVMELMRKRVNEEIDAIEKEPRTNHEVKSDAQGKRRTINNEIAHIRDSWMTSHTVTSNAKSAVDEIERELKRLEKWNNARYQLNYAAMPSGDGYGIPMSGGGSAPPLPARAGTPAMTRAGHMSGIDGIRMTSGYRPGAITATGGRSYHGQMGISGPGRATDWFGPVGALRALSHWIVKNYPHSREVIYSQPGGANWWNGRPHRYSGVTWRNHLDHVHWALKDGGWVKARPGGVSAILAEGGQDEVVSPVPLLREIEAEGNRELVGLMRETVQLLRDQRHQVRGYAEGADQQRDEANRHLAHLERAAVAVGAGPVDVDGAVLRASRRAAEARRP